MIKKIIMCFMFFQSIQPQVKAQLKFLVEDFEGHGVGNLNENNQGFFTFGIIDASIQKNQNTESGYSGSRSLQIKLNSKKTRELYFSGLFFY